MRPLMLDLFCGAGGVAKGYYEAGFEVIGVDVAPQPNYPYAFDQRDVMMLDLSDIYGYDPAVIHASPPCQADCAYRRRGAGVGDGYGDHIAAARRFLALTDLPYVIENVEGARHKLRDPVRYCGSSFGLDVRRHRLFESNVPLVAPPCDHGWQTPRFPAATNRAPMSRRTVEVGVYRIPLATQQAAMGIEWMTLRELSEAIPPAYGEDIGRQLIAAL